MRSLISPTTTCVPAPRLSREPAQPTNVLCSVSATAHYTINLNKAQRLLGEVQKRQTMYITAAQHFDKMNNSKYDGGHILGVEMHHTTPQAYALALKLLRLFLSSG